jgi:hypothetical protein
MPSAHRFANGQLPDCGAMRGLLSPGIGAGTPGPLTEIFIIRQRGPCLMLTDGAAGVTTGGAALSSVPRNARQPDLAMKAALQSVSQVIFSTCVAHLQPFASFFCSNLQIQAFTRASSRRMFSKSVSIGTPGVGFVLGLVVTYGLADAGPGPVTSRILKDALVSQTSVGLKVRVGDEGLASFDERFAGSKVKKESLASYPHLASLEVGLDAGVLVDGPSVSAPSSGILLAESSDSFVERFAGTKVVIPAPVARPPESSWVVQLIGDDTEETALSRFRQMQNKHKAILGIYKPLVVNTALRPGAPSIWTRVRVGLTSREAAESLCAKLESAGERCVVQRNADANNPKQQVKQIEDSVERTADAKAVSKRAG